LGSKLLLLVGNNCVEVVISRRHGVWLRNGGQIGRGMIGGQRGKGRRVTRRWRILDDRGGGELGEVPSRRIDTLKIVRSCSRRPDSVEAISTTCGRWSGGGGCTEVLAVEPRDYNDRVRDIL
jgi:hypothetical protein